MAVELMKLRLDKYLADMGIGTRTEAVSYTHLRAHETDSYLVCRLLLEKKKTTKKQQQQKKKKHKTHILDT